MSERPRISSAEPARDTMVHRTPEPAANGGHTRRCTPATDATKSTFTMPRPTNAPHGCKDVSRGGGPVSCLPATR